MIMERTNIGSDLDWNVEKEMDWEDADFKRNFEEFERTMKRQHNPQEGVPVLNSFEQGSAAPPQPEAGKMPPPRNSMHIAKSVEEYNKWAREIRDDNVCAFIMFSTTWCGPCRAITPRVERFLEDNPLMKGLVIDGDLCEKIVSQFQIKSYPTFVCIKDNKIEKKIIGADWGLLNDWLQHAVDYMKSKKAKSAPPIQK